MWGYFLRLVLYQKLLIYEETMIVVHPIIYPIIALVAGVIILIFPTILNYVIAVYLIIIGILGIIFR